LSGKRVAPHPVGDEFEGRNEKESEKMKNGGGEKSFQGVSPVMSFRNRYRPVHPEPPA
jgi:hypothetical protein